MNLVSLRFCAFTSGLVLVVSGLAWQCRLFSDPQYDVHQLGICSVWRQMYTQPRNYQQHLQTLHAPFLNTALVQTISAIPASKEMQDQQLSPDQKKWLQDVVGKKANMDQRYYLLSWGCGTSCQTGVLLEARGQSLLRLPTAEWGYQYQANSRLLITNPPDGEPLQDRPDWAHPNLYVLHANEFQQLIPGTCLDGIKAEAEY